MELAAGDWFRKKLTAKIELTLKRVRNIGVRPAPVIVLIGPENDIAKKKRRHSTTAKAAIVFAR